MLKKSEDPPPFVQKKINDSTLGFLALVTPSYSGRQEPELSRIRTRLLARLSTDPSDRVLLRAAMIKFVIVRSCLVHFAFCIFVFLEGNLQHLNY